MGFLKRLLGVGVTAGATVAAMKVAEKYKENAEKSDGGDINGDGKVDFSDTVAGVKQAAIEVYGDVAGKVAKAADSAKEKAPEFAAKAKEEITEFAKDAKETVKDVVDDIKK